MWYMFKNEKCMGVADNMPDMEDIKSIGYIVVQDDKRYDITHICLKDGKIVDKPEEVIVVPSAIMDENLVSLAQAIVAQEARLTALETKGE